MAFDETLAERVRKQIGKKKEIVEKKMFGGVAFLLNGNMSIGIHGQELIVRLDPEESDKALSEPHTRVFDITGRPMKGWILVGPSGVADDKSLRKWIGKGTDYASSLPAKR